MLFYHYSHQIFTFLTIALMSTHLMSTANAEPLDNQRPRSIHVSGTGKVSATPDKADLTLSVSVQAKTAEAARNQAATAMEALIKAVKDADFADKDIQTRSVSLYPSYSRDTANKIIGYQLTNQVAVCIRDISKASDIIDSAVKAGGNSTRVQGINFAIDDPESALAEAREKAYANAKAKAEQYAKLAGLTLGSPLHISEGTDIPPVPRPYAEMRTMKSAMADGASTPVQAGEQEVTVTVDIMFGIQ
jgi:uncharacterized protein YggE